MYSYGVSGQRSAKRTSYTLPLIVVAIGTALVLVAGTIIIALIPVFITQRSVTPNDKAFKSSEGVMMVTLEKDTTGRRKRADLSDYIPSVFDVGGLGMLHDKLSAIVVGKQIKEMTITNASLNYINQRRRKRLALSKRQLFSGTEIVLTIKFYIIYQLSCPASCQTKLAPTIQGQLKNTPTSSLEFSNVPLLFNNQRITVTRIKFDSVFQVLPILPSSSTDTVTIPTFAVSSTTTTTTPSVSGPIG